MGQDKAVCGSEISNDTFGITFEVPEETKPIDFKNNTITPKEMARRAFDCACHYRNLINSVLKNCTDINRVMYMEYLASLMGLATEIFMKSLLFHQQTTEFVQVDREHNIFILFEELTDKVRSKIYAEYCARKKQVSMSDFKESIKKNRKNFTLYRYAYELDGMAIDFDFIKSLMETLYKVGCEVILNQ